MDIVTSQSKLDHLDFADDLALLSHTKQQMQEKTNIKAEHSARLGLNVHRGKSKILKVYSTVQSQSYWAWKQWKKSTISQIYGQRR